MAVINGTVVGAEAGFYPKEIEQSLRFNDNDSAFLSWTPASAGNMTTMTYSFWWKRGNIGTVNDFLSVFSGSNDFRIMSEGDALLISSWNGGGRPLGQIKTSALLRDVSSWYHVVAVVDTTNATASERLRLYINGVRITDLSVSTYPSQNATWLINGTSTHRIGVQPFVNYLDGYLADVHFIDGTAYDATAFGESKNGVWVAKEFAGTYGTNGFYLDFADGGALGNDVSGNNNDWTSTNLASTDVMLDSPTNNFATLSSIEAYSNSVTTYYQGNLEASLGDGSNWRSAIATMQPSSGKWYYEVACENNYNGFAGFGYDNFDMNGSGSYLTATAGSFAYFVSGGIRSNNAQIASATALSNGDIVGIALDIDAGQAKWYRNGSLEATTSFTAGSQCKLGFSNVSGVLWSINFGQDSSFNGYKTAQGYTDDNGYGDFYYAPPTGYLALCTANLPEPAIGPNSASTSDENFNTVLYTGDGTSSNAITGLGFQPDMTWIKIRSQAYNHWLTDSMRGVGVNLIVNGTNAEGYNSGSTTSFDSDGFTVGAAPEVNKSGDSFVAWNWKANGSGVSNTDGSITSTVSANVDAGFSIVGYTGNGSSSQTVGHGLSSAPDVMIVKNRDAFQAWVVYHSANTSEPETDWLRLNDTHATLDQLQMWQDTAPTSSVFTVGNDDAVNSNGADHIAYCFHSVEGFSKFGKFVGNGSTDGPFVALDFEPAFVMIKRTDASANWGMFDNQRLGYNVRNDILYPNLSNAEGAAEWIDFTSNGFKLRYNHAQINASGGTYIYMAFAKAPFKYSNAR